MASHQFEGLPPGVFRAEETSLLGDLADPAKFVTPIVFDDMDPSKLKELLRRMVTIRMTEEMIGSLVQEGKVKCPCHLAIGQEAIAVGVGDLLKISDRSFGGHRSHAHYLSVGGSVHQLIAEILGKESGCSRGMGGSMHIQAPEVGFIGSVPIVGASIPFAVGAAIAAKFDGGDSVAVSYFGDGACEEGVFHESLNLASNLKAPVLFVAENNLYSSHLDIALRQPSDSVARFATAHRIPALVVDGNDVVAVHRAAELLITRCRGGYGPAFLEAVTFRWRGHVGPDENIDVGLRRDSKHLAAWKLRDPIGRLRLSLEQASLLTDPEFKEIEGAASKLLKEVVAQALNDEYPAGSALLNRVYPEHQ